jgi:hypothetical protein
MKGVITEQAATMRNAHTDPPPLGTKVNALNHGGVLVSTVWTKDSINNFDAWSPSPKIPAEVKAIQLARFPI